MFLQGKVCACCKTSALADAATERFAEPFRLFCSARREMSASVRIEMRVRKNGNY